MVYVYVFQVQGLRWFIRNYCGGEDGVKDCSTAQFCERFVKPFVRDHAVRGGTSLRRLLPSVFWDGTQQQKKYFISHAWGTPILEILTTLEKELGGGAAVWLDVVSHNQITTESHLPVWWSSSFHGTIGACDELVMIMHVGQDSDIAVTNPFRRLWCLYEGHSSLENEKPLRIVFTPTSEQRLKSTVGLAKQLFNEAIGTGHATCTSKKDRRMIMKQLIPKGVESFNSAIEKLLKEGMREALQNLDVYTPRRISTSSRQLNETLNSQTFRGPKLSPEQQLIQASKTGDSKKVKELLQQVSSPDCLDSEQKSPLLHAAANGHVEIVQRLMDGKADPALRDRIHDTAMSVAVRNKKFECVGTIFAKLDTSPQRWKIQRFLREPWASHTAVDLWLDIASTWPSGVRNEPHLRRACLQNAVRKGRADAVSKMLQFQELSDLSSSCYEQPLIWTASYQGHFDVVKLLAARGANLGEKARGVSAVEAAKEGLKAAGMSERELAHQLEQGIGGTKPEGRDHASIIEFLGPRLPLPASQTLISRPGTSRT